jgi:16S rRNA processing protein RimM
MSQLIKIGKLSRVHGLKGALVVSGENLESIEIKKKGFLFLEINNISTPFFVSEVKMAGNNMVLTFDSIDTVERAKPFIGKDIYGDEKNVSVRKDTTANLEGYDIVDELKGNVGKVNELIKLPKQQFLSITINKEEVLLPYTDIFVKRIDHKTKTVYYCAPDGLFDINQ